MHANNTQPSSDYIQSINKALMYIDENLDNELNLETIASIAHYSPYHFHRVFKAITNETLKGFITRKRIEKAAAVLMHKEEVVISELSSLFGFNSHSAFTRSFKNFYKLSPTEFRDQHYGKHRKIRIEDSKNRQTNTLPEAYICNIINLKKWTEMNATIIVKEIEEIRMASITHIGIEGVSLAFERLIQWSNKHGLMHKESKLARVFYDSFKVTAPDKVRMSIGLLTEEAFEAKGIICKTIIPKCRSIVARFEIAPEDFEKSWTSLFMWMNRQGYQKADENPFEIYHNDFREHPEGKFITDFYIPIK